jgi:hypothetical protein
MTKPVSATFITWEKHPTPANWICFRSAFAKASAMKGGSEAVMGRDVCFPGVNSAFVC